MTLGKGELHVHVVLSFPFMPRGSLWGRGWLLCGPERDEITRASTLDCGSIRVSVAFWLCCHGYGVFPLTDGYFVLVHTDCSALTEHFLKYVLLCLDLENDEKC